MSKKITVALISIFTAIGLALLACVFTLGDNPDIRPLITTLVKVYICCVPVAGIVQAVIQREEATRALTIALISVWVFVLIFMIYIQFWAL